MFERLKNRIGIFVPYFGVLPNTFEIWLKSASYNDQIDFHLIGDCFNKLNVPGNVIVHEWSFEKLNVAIETMLNARPLSSPYKLCDFKPSYGILFSEFLDDYDIWGFSDLDLMFGDILNTVNFDRLPPNWGRIFDLGHLSFFPNSEIGRRMFENSLHGLNSWDIVKNSRIVWVYDELYYKGIGGLNGRIEQAGYQILPKAHLASDTIPRFQGLFDHHTGLSVNIFYLWEKGRAWKIWKENGEFARYELTYAHFQKRKINVHWIDLDTALVVPKHWPLTATLEEALETLPEQIRYDMRLNPVFANHQGISKHKKWTWILLEMLKSRGGVTALFFYLWNRRRAR